jgi:hypothetical protein
MKSVNTLVHISQGTAERMRKAYQKAFPSTRYNFLSLLFAAPFLLVDAPVAVKVDQRLSNSRR